MDKGQKSILRGLALACLLCPLVSVSSARRNDSLRIHGDIEILDVQNLTGEPEGWKVPADYSIAYSTAKYGESLMTEIRHLARSDLRFQSRHPLPPSQRR